MASANKYVPYESSSAPVAFDNIGTAKSIQNRLLGSASTAENIATGGAGCVRLMATENSWFIFDGTAAVPSGDETSGGDIYLPAGVPHYIQCRNVTNISVVSATANAIVNAIFWD